MTGFTTIDSLVRAALMSHGLTMHYYVTFLHFALQGLREISFDTVGKIATVKLTVNSFKEAPLPPDYIDWVKVGWLRGRNLIPMGSNSTYVRAINTNSEGQQIAYPSGTGAVIAASTYDPFAQYHLSPYGEDLGRIYGLGGGSRNDIFQIVPERNIVLLGDMFDANDSIYMEYLAAGNYSDAEALFHPYAESTLEAFIRFRYAEQRTSRLADVARAEKDFYNQYRMLRARLNGLSKEDMLRLSRDHFKQSIKT
jgi:hypothetical protein